MIDSPRKKTKASSAEAGTEGAARGEGRGRGGDASGEEAGDGEASNLVGSTARGGGAFQPAGCVAVGCDMVVRAFGGGGSGFDR